jgi:hypothetical protein
MIRRMQDERDAMNFRRDVFGIVTMLEGVARELDDPNKPWTSDSLMWLNMSREAQMLRKVLDNPDKVKAFQRLHGSYSHIVDDAQGLAESLDKIHAVFKDVLSHHLTEDRSDVHQVFKEDHPFNLNDRAQFNGLTPEQQALYEAHTDTTGYLYLSAAERATLRDAILAEFQS